MARVSSVTPPSRACPNSSSAVRCAIVHAPNLPVSFVPASGFATVRVYTRLLGDANSSIPSRKNGRRSGKKSANRSLIVTSPASDSTCEKSGLIVASSVSCVKPKPEVARRRLFAARTRRNAPSSAARRRTGRR